MFQVIKDFSTLLQYIILFITDDIAEAYNLIKDLEPTTPQEYILKGVVNAALGQEQMSVSGRYLTDSLVMPAIQKQNRNNLIIVFEEYCLMKRSFCYSRCHLIIVLSLNIMNMITNSRNTSFKQQAVMSMTLITSGRNNTIQYSSCEV